MSAYVVAVADVVGPDAVLRADVLPPRLRRGLSTHQRLVLDRIAAVTDEPTRATVRFVHGSEFGELETAAFLARSIEPAPARFSTSVHSTAIGLASIAFGNRVGHTTLSAGDDTLAACLVDALAGLEEERDTVVVVADETSSAFPTPPPRAFGFALRLSRRSVPGAPRLEVVPDGDAARPITLDGACAALAAALREGGDVPAVRPGFPTVRVVLGGTR